MPQVVLGQYAEANKKFRQLIEAGLILGGQGGEITLPFLYLSCQEY